MRQTVFMKPIPKAKLLYNDFNVTACGYGRSCCGPFGKSRWSLIRGRASKPHAPARLALGRPGNLCERYARYGWPLHFTELTVINGRCTKDVDYTIGNPNSWISLPEDLEKQREYTRAVLYPAVQPSGGRGHHLVGFPGPAVDGRSRRTGHRGSPGQTGL